MAGRPFDPDALDPLALIDPVSDLIRAVSTEIVLPRHRNLAREEIRDKGVNDLVTIADEEAETRLTAELRALLPGSVVVGEEAAAADPGVMDRLRGPDPVWIIDPVDGTGNFSRGSDVFAVMVALAREGRTLAGWIHQPVGDLMLTAALGAGARINAAPLPALPVPEELSAMRGAVHTGYVPAGPREAISGRLGRFASNTQLYCAGLTYMGLVQGAFDHALFWRAKPWDHAAGALALAELGGRTAFESGQTYGPARAERNGLVSVRASARWPAVRAALFED
ncbi:MAG: inositol monophosphatase [Alphaproteobacteria bacterium]|nr:inositol monophosphatase [Alphaproteobacteria bacterium]